MATAYGMRNALLFAALLALSCGGEANREPEQCSWPEPLDGECYRFTGTARFGLEGSACEPAACLVVPFGDNEGTVQQVEVREPGPTYSEADGPPDAFQVDLGSCAELACP